MTHRGKIAHLPRELRRQLNERLDDGFGGVRLLAWLNNLPEVQQVLAEQFGGAPINHPNLTAWRQSGYAEWLEQQRIAATARQLAEAALKPARRNR